MTWNKAAVERLQTLWRETGYPYRKLAESMSEEFDSDFSFDMVRNYIRRHREIFPSREGEILPGGFVPKWGTFKFDNEGGIETSWIRGAKEERDWHSELLEAISNAKPVEVEFNPEQRLDKNTLLEVPLFDMHFGIASFEHYAKTHSEVAKHIVRGHDTVVFAIGSDLFHNNDHRGRTAKGTQIEKVDMEKAFNGAALFYVSLIRLAIKHSNNVEVLYIKGNHDETPSWYFCKYLEALFPDIPFDLRFTEKKVFTWRKIFIGYTHGD
ncbi:MAG: hypothetical protein EOM07_12415, partial [Clostridia bacterium]|nr:hypothetical protein [Clostridia bacterium]